MSNKIVAVERAWFEADLDEWQELNVALGVALPNMQKPRTIVAVERNGLYATITLNTGQSFVLLPDSLSDSLQEAKEKLFDYLERDGKAYNDGWNDGYIRARKGN